jgi:hypothetical protein
MDFTGLLSSYPTLGMLTGLDKDLRLHQEHRLNVTPHYQLSVIKMDSNCLDSVDKWYAWKGLLTAVGAAIVCIFSYGIIAVGFSSLDIPWGKMTADDKLEQVLFTLVITILSFPLIWIGVWLIRKESFAYTHYPIRFDRKNKTVYVFRTDGTTLSVSWDQVFFTLGHLKQWNEWEVRGHVLDSDRVTIRETFALSYVGSLNVADTKAGVAQYSSEDFVRAHWEFVRRFMEDGPDSISNQVQFCMPIDGRRESIYVSIERVFANFAGAPLLIYFLMFPFCCVVSMFRIIAMRTSKIPKWPEEIEYSCALEPDDSYAIVGAPDGKRVAVFPEAAAAAGIYYGIPSFNQHRVDEGIGER